MAEGTIPVDRAGAKKALAEVLRRLPAGWSIMPIGALGMIQVLDDDAQRTKDVGLVAFLVVAEGFQIPSASVLVELAKTLSDSVELRKDQTCVTLMLDLEEGRVKVELVRGRNPASGGFFVTRRVLEACAKMATPRGNLLELPGEGLAFLKAWAATDQDKLIESGRDANGFHRARAAAFRQDVANIALSFLDRGKPPPRREIEKLLGSCPAERRARIEIVLRSAGWEL
jgi:hypothetical protein